MKYFKRFLLALVFAVVGSSSVYAQCDGNVYTVADTFDCFFTTRQFSSGAPFALAGSPVVSAYEDNSTTQITAGITLTASFDSVTGLNHMRIVATGANGYEAGKSYSLVITTGTVDSVSVVGEVIGTFSLRVLDVNVAQVSDDATAADNLESAADNYSATRGLSGTALPAAAADAAGGLPISDAGGLDLDTTDSNVSAILTDTGTTLDNFVDDLEARLGTPSDLGGGATVAANLSDIEGQTDDIGAAGAGLTALATAAALATVDGNVDSILVDTGTTLDDLVDDLESRLGTPSDFGSGTSTIAANLEDLADNGTASYDRSTDSLQALRDRGDAAWTTGGSSGQTGTAQTATHSTTALVLASGEVVEDNNFLHWTVEITNGDCADQARTITASTASTDTVTVGEAFDEGGSCAIDADVDGATYALHPPAAPAFQLNDITAASVWAVGTRTLTALDEDDTTIDLDGSTVGDVTNAINIDQIEGSDATDQINAAADTALTDYDPPTDTEMDSGFSGLNDLSAAAVNAEVDTALADIDLDHLISAAESDTPADDSIIAKLAASDGDWSGFSETTDALEALRDRGDAAWTTGGSSGQTGTAQTATHSTTALVLASGEVVEDNNFQYWTVEITNGDCADQARTIISSTASSDTVTVDEAFDEGGSCAINADVDGATYALHPPAGPGFALDTAASISTTVWAESTRELTALDEDNTTIDLNASTVGDVSSAVNIDQIEGSDATDQINAAADTALADYDPPTDTEMDSAFAALNDVSTAQVNAEVDTALADYDPPTDAEMDSGFAGLNDVSTAQVNAEVDTALSDVGLDNTDAVVDLILSIVSTRQNTAQAGSTSSSIVLDSGASSTDDFYKFDRVVITGGTGVGQDRVIDGYTGVSTTATVRPNWATTPDNTSTFAIIPANHANTEWFTQANVSLGGPGSSVPNINLQYISADSTAADNLEAFFDGAGYDATANSINVTQIEGSDATDQINAAADASAETYGLDHLLAASVAGADVTDDSIIAQMVSASATADWDDFDNTTEAHQALRDRGDAAWTTGAGGAPPQLMQSTTIATLSTQTSFTLTAGSDDDAAYAGGVAVITDQSTSTQKAYATIDTYTGSSRTIALLADPAVFTMAVGDTIDIMTPLGSAGSAPTAGQNADAVWAELIADHDGVSGSTAEALADALADTNELQGAQNWDVWDDGARTLTELDEDNTTIDLDASTVGDVTNAINIDQIEGSDATDQINAAADTALTDYDPPTDTEMDSGFAGLNDITAAAVWAAGTRELTTLDEDNTTIDLDGSTVGDVTSAINVDQIEGSDATDQINAAADTALSDYDGPTDTEMDSGFAGLNDLSAAAVNAEVDTALTDYDPPTAAELTSEINDVQSDVAAVDANVDSILIDTGTTLQAEVDGIQTDTEDIQARLPTALVSGKMDSDATSISGSAAAADTMESMMVDTVIDGSPYCSAACAAVSGTLSITQMSANLATTVNSETIANDHYLGLVLTWTSGPLAGQSTNVTGYNATTKVLTFTAVTVPPEIGNTFVMR